MFVATARNEAEIYWFHMQLICFDFSSVSSRSLDQSLNRVFFTNPRESQEAELEQPQLREDSDRHCPEAFPGLLLIENSLRFGDELSMCAKFGMLLQS